LLLEWTSAVILLEMHEVAPTILVPLWGTFVCVTLFYDGGRGESQETEGRRQEAGGRRQEAGGRRQVMRFRVNLAGYKVLVLNLKFQI
jgi:hypothetical protein